jgi:ribose transport system substrate-binding protein
MKKLKGTSLVIALSFLFIVLISGCGSQTAKQKDTGAVESNSQQPVTKDTSSTSSSEASEQIIIGYNAYGDSVDFSKKVTEGLMKSAEAINAKVLKADTNGDTQTALANTESFIAQGAHVIIDTTWSISAGEAIAKKCLENNVAAIISDIPVETEGAYYMGVSNPQVGTITGKAVADYAKKNWDSKIDNMLITYIEKWGDGVKPRVSNVPVAVREAGIDLPDEKITYVDPQSSDATVTSKQLATDFLTAHPDSKRIVLVACNEQAAQGLLAGVETSNRSDDCIVVSVGLDNLGIENLYKEQPNAWIGSTAFFPEKFGEVMVKMIQDMHAGKEVEQAQYIENVFVDRNNISQYYPNPNK